MERTSDGVGANWALGLGSMVSWVLGGREGVEESWLGVVLGESRREDLAL